jgi:hypothetical protein
MAAPSLDWNARIVAYLNLDVSTDKDRGDLLARLGGACQRAVEGEISRTFENVSALEVYNGNGRPSLFLRRDPVISVESLMVNGTTIPVDDPLAPTWPPGRVVIDEAAALHFTDGSCFPRGVANVLVNYTAGLAIAGQDGAVPEDLLFAVTYWAAQLFTDAERIGLGSVTVQEQVTSFTHKLPDDVKDMVSGWKRGYVPC